MTFPEDCTFLVSNKPIHKIEPLPPTSPLKRRNDEEVHIDKFLLTYLNTLTVKEKHDYMDRTNASKSYNHLIAVVSTKASPVSRVIKQNFLKNRLSVR